MLVVNNLAFNSNLTREEQNAKLISIFTAFNFHNLVFFCTGGVIDVFSFLHMYLMYI